MKEDGSYALGRKTDLVICYPGDGDRMLDEWSSIAACMLLESLGSYVECPFYYICSSLVVSREHFLDPIHIILYINTLIFPYLQILLKGPHLIAVLCSCHEVQVGRSLLHVLLRLLRCLFHLRA